MGNATYDPAASIVAAVTSMPMAKELKLRFLQIGAGEAVVEIPFDERWTFRPGQYQATPVFALADFAGVCAAASLLAEGWFVATVDVSLKMLAPAKEGGLRARGRVVGPGKLLTVASADVYWVEEGRETLCATALVTARNLPPA